MNHESQNQIEPGILSEEVLSQSGSFKRVRRFLQGHHPERGKLTEGWSGPETIEETDLISPAAVVYVYDPKKEKDMRHNDNLAHFTGFYRGNYYENGRHRPNRKP